MPFFDIDDTVTHPPIMTTMTMTTVEQVRSSNWLGSIPIILSLAPTSLSSPTIPPPIHLLVSRHTFLHVALQDAVLRFQQYAPPSFTFPHRIVIDEPHTTTITTTTTVEEEDPPSSHNDEEGEKETKVNAETTKNEDIGVGDSSSSLPHKNSEKGTLFTKNSTTTKYPQCWFEDEESELPLQWQLFVGVLYDSYTSSRSKNNSTRTDQTNTTMKTNQLPWRIRIHFTNYPSSHLLDLDHIHGDVLMTVQRTFRNSLKQALVLEHGQNKVALNMTKLTQEKIWDSIITSKYSIYKPIQEDIQPTTTALDLIPVRLMIGPSKPMIQKRCSNRLQTLGGLLEEWLPAHYLRINDDATQARAPISDRLVWRIAGITPPLDSLVIDLWLTLCQPDNFLYIIVLAGD